jgi:hypothetical protein
MRMAFAIITISAGGGMVTRCYRDLKWHVWFQAVTGPIMRMGFVLVTAVVGRGTATH